MYNEQHVLSIYSIKTSSSSKSEEFKLKNIECLVEKGGKP